REEADEIARTLARWPDRTHAGYQRGLGIVRARFVVREPSRPELAHGLFASARAYPCLVRFSSFGEPASHRGIAIKILDEDRGGEPITIQDFVLSSLERCPFAGISDYTPEAIAALGSSLPADPLVIAYFGQLPVRLGPRRAMKFAIRPCDGGFEFAIQLQEDPEREPIEDASIPWQTPWIPVAALRLGELDSIDDPRSFASPFQCLADHDPLGRIDRLRRHLYQDPTPDQREFPFVPRSQRICVVGAGAAGMAAADALSQRGHEVVLVERRARPGGHAESTAHGLLE